MTEADRPAQHLTALNQQMFDLVANLPVGNAFTNANKAIDHFFAYGPNASKVLPPRLHGGINLPNVIIESTRQLLVDYGYMPNKGYLE